MAVRFLSRQEFSMKTKPEFKNGWCLQFKRHPAMRAGVLLLCLAAATSPAQAASATYIAAWGRNDSGQSDVPAGLSSVVAVAVGGYHSMALRNDGTVAAWGDNSGGQCNVPAGLSNVVAIAAGATEGLHCLVLRDDGTVVAWGLNDCGQTNVPAGLSNIVAIAVGDGHDMVLRDNKTVMAWGDNWHGPGQTNVPAGLSNVVAIAGGGRYSLAVRDNGTVVAWGANWGGQCNVPAGLSNVVAVAGGAAHSVALRANGTVVAWGYNNFGQCNVPAGLSNVVAISAGSFYCLALRADGTVVAWGDNGYGQTNVPAGLSNVVAVAAGNGHCLALVAAVPPTIVTPPQSQTAEDGSIVNLAARITGFPPPSCQWFFNGIAIAGCTNHVLSLSGIQASNAGTYTVVVSSTFGSVTSAPAMLNVIPLVGHRPVPGIRLTGETGSLLNVDYAGSISSAPNWQAFDTVNLTNPPQYCFDLTMPLPPERFYRAWQSGTPGVIPSLNLNLVPAITLTGNISDSLRVDCINQIGPTDAWVTLDTVTLTNTLQHYFDVSAPGQPPRLYRIMPNP
jgi:hypothetical protein